MQKKITILVADEDKQARDYITSIAQDRGYHVIQAIDVGSAIKVLEEWPVDAAVIAHKIKPKGGFEIARHALIKGKKVGVIMLTENPTTEILLQAGNNGVGQVMRIPVEPDRLFEAIKRILKAKGISADGMTDGMDKLYSHEELMQRALALAAQNMRGNLGGPFGAVVADAEGRILGEGVNGVRTRSDPTAHAEVMAIRRATDKLGNTRLDGCIVYCSSEPTMLGEALIIGTGIKQVYYGLSHEEAGTVRAEDVNILNEIAKPIDKREVTHTQIGKDEALALFKDWKK